LGGGPGVAACGALVPCMQTLGVGGGVLLVLCVGGVLVHSIAVGWEWDCRGHLEWDVGGGQVEWGDAWDDSGLDVDGDAAVQAGWDMPGRKEMENGQSGSLEVELVGWA